MRYLRRISYRASSSRCRPTWIGSTMSAYSSVGGMNEGLYQRRRWFSGQSSGRCLSGRGPRGRRMRQSHGRLSRQRPDRSRVPPVRLHVPQLDGQDHPELRRRLPLRRQRLRGPERVQPLLRHQEHRSGLRLDDQRRDRQQRAAVHLLFEHGALRNPGHGPVHRGHDSSAPGSVRHRQAQLRGPAGEPRGRARDGIRDRGPAQHHRSQAEVR